MRIRGYLYLFIRLFREGEHSECRAADTCYLQGVGYDAEYDEREQDGDHRRESLHGGDDDGLAIAIGIDECEGTDGVEYLNTEASEALGEDLFPREEGRGVAVHIVGDGDEQEGCECHPDKDRLGVHGVVGELHEESLDAPCEEDKYGEDNPQPSADGAALLSGLQREKEYSNEGDDDTGNLPASRFFPEEDSGKRDNDDGRHRDEGVDDIGRSERKRLEEHELSSCSEESDGASE